VTGPVVITDAAVEAAARALVWERHAGCVSWEEAGAEGRGYALGHARAALEAAIPHLAPGPGADR